MGRTNDKNGYQTIMCNFRLTFSNNVFLGVERHACQIQRKLKERRKNEPPMTLYTFIHRVIPPWIKNIWKQNCIHTEHIQTIFSCYGFLNVQDNNCSCDIYIAFSCTSNLQMIQSMQKGPLWSLQLLWILVAVKVLKPIPGGY